MRLCFLYCALIDLSFEVGPCLELPFKREYIPQNVGMLKNLH